jgi:hypothetical protein
LFGVALLESNQPLVNSLRHARGTVSAVAPALATSRTSAAGLAHVEAGLSQDFVHATEDQLGSATLIFIDLISGSLLFDHLLVAN